MNNKSVHNDIIDAPEFKPRELSGRASWDDRGNSVWEWQTAPGVYSREISTQQLQALQASELRVIDSMPSDVALRSTTGRGCSDALAPAAIQSTEMVIPARRKESASKAPAFDNFLKRLLPS